MMSGERQARVYLEEARLTLEGEGERSVDVATSGAEFWAESVQIVYDGIELAMAAAIAAAGDAVPAKRAGKLAAFLERYEIDPDLGDRLHAWLRRCEAQDGNREAEDKDGPSGEFGMADLEAILADADDVMAFVIPVVLAE